MHSNKVVVHVTDPTAMSWQVAWKHADGSLQQENNQRGDCA